MYYFVPESELTANAGGKPFYKPNGIPKCCRETNPRKNNHPTHGAEVCVVLSVKKASHACEHTFLANYTGKTKAEADAVLATDEWKYTDPVAE